MPWCGDYMLHRKASLELKPTPCTILVTQGKSRGLKAIPGQDQNHGVMTVLYIPSLKSINEMKQSLRSGVRKQFRISSNTPIQAGLFMQS